MQRETLPEPTGVGLKASYLLLRELKRYPQLPSIEQTALILDEVLHYEWAVRIIRVAEHMEERWGHGLDKDDGVVQFNDWAANNLLGPDMEEQVAEATARTSSDQTTTQ